MEKQEQEEKSTAAKLQGNVYFQREQYDKAIAEYSNAISLNNGDHTFYSNRSLCYFKLGRYEEAISDGRKCMGLKPAWTKGHCRTAYPLIKVGHFGEAEDIVSKGVVLIVCFSEMISNALRFTGFPH